MTFGLRTTLIAINTRNDEKKQLLQFVNVAFIIITRRPTPNYYDQQVATYSYETRSTILTN